MSAVLQCFVRSFLKAAVQSHPPIFLEKGYLVLHAMELLKTETKLGSQSNCDTQLIPDQNLLKVDSVPHQSLSSGMSFSCCSLSDGAVAPQTGAVSG